jgi:hypothetical protein
MQNRHSNCSDICMSPSGCNEIVEYPGYANLSTYGYPPWTNFIGSFTCSPTGDQSAQKRRRAVGGGKRWWG